MYSDRGCPVPCPTTGACILDDNSVMTGTLARLVVIRDCYTFLHDAGAIPAFVASGPTSSLKSASIRADVGAWLRGRPHRNLSGCRQSCDTVFHGRAGALFERSFELLV